MLRPGKPGGSASTGVSKGSARRGIPAWRRVISERNSTHRAKCAGRCCTSRDWGFTKRISTGSVSARRCWHRRLPITTRRCFTTCSMLQKPSVRAKTRSVWCWGTGVMSPRAIRGCAISDFRRCFCSWSWNMPTARAARSSATIRGVRRPQGRSARTTNSTVKSTMPAWRCRGGTNPAMRTRRGCKPKRWLPPAENSPCRPTR